jgi:hypothetical protein
MRAILGSRLDVHCAVDIAVAALDRPAVESTESHTRVIGRHLWGSSSMMVTLFGRVIASISWLCRCFQVRLR